MDRPKALVVDADPAVQNAIVATFVEHGFDASSARVGTPRTDPIDVVAADLGPPPVREWVSALRRAQPGLLLVALGNENETSLDPFDSVDKPLDFSRLRSVARRLRSVVVLRAENRALLVELQRRASAAGIVGRSRATRELIDALTAHARESTSVWFAGEPGVGKEHAARVMHAMSERSGLDFVIAPCASIAFAEPVLTSPCGTLYLENLPTLPIEHQRQVERRAADDGSGDTGRLVASAPTIPARAVELGRLLDELRERFEPRVIVIPPLRERPDDVPALARHFADRIGEANRLPGFEIEAPALAMLEAHTWPGNAAELRSAIEHAALLATDARIGLEHLPESIRNGASERTVRDSGVASVAPATFRAAKRTVVASFEASYLRELLAYHGGNVTAAARHAGMLRSALQRLLRKHGLRSGEFRGATGRHDARTLAPPVDEPG